MNFWKHATKSKLPGVIGWNLIKLAYEVFVQKYGVLCLENFDHPTGISPLFFSQLCVFYHWQSKWILNQDSVTLNNSGQQQLSKKNPKTYHQIKMGY